MTDIRHAVDQELTHGLEADFVLHADSPIEAVPPSRNLWAKLHQSWLHFRSSYFNWFNRRSS